MRAGSRGPASRIGGLLMSKGELEYSVIVSAREDRRRGDRRAESYVPETEGSQREMRTNESFGAGGEKSKKQRRENKIFLKSFLSKAARLCKSFSVLSGREKEACPRDDSKKTGPRMRLVAGQRIVWEKDARDKTLTGNPKRPAA